MNDQNETAIPSSIDDPEIASFFQELESAGVLSGDALKEIRSDYKSVQSSQSNGRLQQEPKLIESKDEDDQDLRAKLQDMSIAEKIKLALLGDGTCRQLLVTDTNRLVQQSVLANPRLQVGEVETFAKNPNVSDFILRTIGTNRTWLKSYLVKLNLVTNPKTPNDIALKWLRYLNKNDLRNIAKSKNIPQLISVTAKKQLAQSQ